MMMEMTADDGDNGDHGNDTPMLGPDALDRC